MQRTDVRLMLSLLVFLAGTVHSLAILLAYSQNCSMSLAEAKRFFTRIWVISPPQDI